MPDLKRFKDAQNLQYVQAKKEIEEGKKKGCWVWYIFPQLKVLGRSSMAQEYGIENLDEACEYLQDPDLSKKYLEMIKLVLTKLKEKNDLKTLMGGEPDDKKLCSSMTLFNQAAQTLCDKGDKNKDLNELKDCIREIFELVKKDRYTTCDSTLKNISNNSKPKHIGYSPTLWPSGIKTSNSADFSELSRGLKQYIDMRQQEWGFHYNFLGIMSIFYWLQDFLTGSDHFNDKNRSIKISAAEKLSMLINGSQDKVEFSEAEKMAMHQGRLGKIVEPYKLDSSCKNIETNSSKSFK